MRLFYWLGWALIIGAWIDWSLSTLLGYDVWRENLGIVIPGTLWNMTPIMIGCFGLVLIATCR